MASESPPNVANPRARRPAQQCLRETPDEGAGGAHAARGARRADRSIRSAEPILVPKVRIRFAEFPSPLSAVRPEAANLGHLMRFWVRSRDARIPPARIFTGPTSRPKATRLSSPFSPRRATSPIESTPSRARLNFGREPKPVRGGASPSRRRRRRHASRPNGAPQRVRRVAETRGAASRGTGSFAGFPFAARGPRAPEARALREKRAPHTRKLTLDRTAHRLRGRLGSDSPRLVRRSTGNLAHVGPPGSTEVQATATSIGTSERSTRPRDRASTRSLRPPTRRSRSFLRAPGGRASAATAGDRSIDLSAIHFRGRAIRSVSCYTFPRGCRLPWPPADCLYDATLFVVSDSRPFGT